LLLSAGSAARLVIGQVRGKAERRSRVLTFAYAAIFDRAEHRCHTATRRIRGGEPNRAERYPNTYERRQVHAMDAPQA